MKQHYTETYKRQIVKRYLKGESVISLSKETSISRSTIYGWLQKYKPAKATEKIKTTDYNRLKRTVERQAQIIKILKTVNCNVHSDLIVRMNELEKLLGDYNKHGLILHSDNGSNYISAGFEKCLAKNNITHSFSRPHNPHDNAVSEAFFASMKKEELYRRKYESVASFMKAIESYIQFYNEKRPHAALNYKTPVQFEAEYENTEQQP